MGAYWLSAGCVNLLPTRQSFQPFGQQAGVFALQYFCIRKKPTPPTDQSVAKLYGEMDQTIAHLLSFPE